MADAKISALPATTTAAGTDIFPVDQAGTTKGTTLTQINAYCEPVSAASTAAQTGFATDTYVTGSGVTIAAARIQAGTFYRFKCDLTKTAAGVATAVATLRMGTAGTTSDAAICTFTFPSAGTAAIDKGLLEVLANFRSVGSGTSAVVQGTLFLIKQNSNTGFVSAGTVMMAPLSSTSSGFDSTAVTKVGLSVNAGASASWTITTAQADILNVI